MSLVATQPSLARSSYLIRMEAITPSAEKQVKRLSPTGRSKVIAALTQAIPRERCELVTSLRQHRVFHFDTTDTIRVSYREVDGQTCVIHVGTHPEFDRFANCYRGTLPNRLIPIEESDVMKQNHKRPQTNNPAVTAMIADGAPSPTTAREGAHLLSRAILSIFDKAFDGKKTRLDADIEARDQLLDEQLGRLKEQLAGQKNALQSLEQVITQQGRHFQTDFATLRQDFNIVKAESDSRVRDLEARLASTAVTLDNQVQARLGALTAEIVGSMTPLATRIDGLLEEHQTLLRQFSVRDQLAQEMAVALAASQEKSRALDSALGRNEHACTALAAKVNQLAAAVHEIAEAFARQQVEREQRSFTSRLNRLYGTLRSAVLGLIPRSLARS